jgi:hypothetical protein
MALHFNAEGKPLGFTGSYFMISVTCLDYLLRLMRLEIVDCLMLRATRRGSHKLARVCAVCRALPDWHPGNRDEWMKVCARTFASPRFQEPSIVWRELETGREPVAYEPVNERRALRKSTGDVDLYRTVRRSRPIGARASGLLGLGLDDRV